MLKIEPNTRYFFACDDNAHWYLIPEKNRQEWYKWMDVIENSESTSYDIDIITPEYAQRLDYHLTNYSFTNPSSVL